MGSVFPGVAVTEQDEWEPSGDDTDPTSRLALVPHLTLFGVPMHVEAHAVQLVDGVQTADHSWGADAQDAIDRVDAGDGPRMTKSITVDGRTRDYILLAYPYC